MKGVWEKVARGYLRKLLLRPRVKRTVKTLLSFTSGGVNEQTPRKLHLGCGAVKIGDFCNVDVDRGLYPDVKDDILRLKKFPNCFAETIYACHVLEHVAHAEVAVVLRRWFEVLTPGGELRISVPDLDRIVTIYKENWDHFQHPGNTPWIGLIYGGQDDQYDFHKTGFNFNWARYLLIDAGFVDVEEYPHEPHWLGIEDASLAHEPFGQYISLNVKARRPN